MTTEARSPHHEEDEGREPDAQDTESKSPFAMVPPSWKHPTAMKTSPVGGTAPATPRSRPKPWIVNGLPFGGIFGPSRRLRGRRGCRAVSEARASLSPAKLSSMLEEDPQGGGKFHKCNIC